jgi:hypothetical protein
MNPIFQSLGNGERVVSNGLSDGWTEAQQAELNSLCLARDEFFISGLGGLR